MKKNHMNLFFPQWQGAGRTKTLLEGAQEIKEKYLGNYHFSEIEVDDEDIDDIVNDILGYSKIVTQLKNASLMVSKENPESIFTIGGGCDVEIVPVSYLNEKFNGDVTVLWIDAHGDLNTPESSPSKNFHGMPLRTLLGDGDSKIAEILFSQLLPSQILLIGQRSLDEPERKYIEERKIDQISIEEIVNNIEHVINVIKTKNSNNIYIHIDLDVLDLEDFPYVMVPEPNGLKSQLLFDLLAQLNENFNIVGLSLLEYIPSDEKNIKIISDIIQLGMNI